jgi:hypothetical protein
MQNTFSTLHHEDVQTTIDEIDAVERKLDELIAEVADLNVYGIDPVEFKNYMMDAFGDSLGATRTLAQRGLADQGQAMAAE